MTKRLVIIALAAIMMLGAFGLAACDNISLDEYKATKSQALQDYADAKGEGNYYTDGWQAVCKAVTDGKVAIESAETKPVVTKAYDDAKAVIDAVEEKIVGAFYTLQEASDEGWLTALDLKNIAFYYRGNGEDGFVASPKIPAELSVSTESKIKHLYLSDLQKKVPEATLADIRIEEYYGTYGNCVVVKVWDDCIDYDLSFIPEQLIDGVLFTNYCEREIYIYTTAK